MSTVYGIITDFGAHVCKHRQAGWCRNGTKKGGQTGRVFGEGAVRKGTNEVENKSSFGCNILKGTDKIALPFVQYNAVK